MPRNIDSHTVQDRRRYIHYFQIISPFRMISVITTHHEYSVLRVICVIRACVVLSRPQRIVPYTTNRSPGQISIIDNQIGWYVPAFRVNILRFENPGIYFLACLVSLIFKGCY